MTTPPRNPLIGVLNLIDPRRDWPRTLDPAGIASLHAITADLLAALRRHYETQTPEELARPWADNPGITPEIRYALSLGVGARYAAAPMEYAQSHFTPASQALRAAMTAGFAWRDSLVDPTVPGRLTVTSKYETVIMEAACWSRAMTTASDLTLIVGLLRTTGWTRRSDSDSRVWHFTRPWANGPLDERTRPTLQETLDVVTRPGVSWVPKGFALNGIDHTWPELVEVMVSGRDVPRADGLRPDAGGPE